MSWEEITLGEILSVKHGWAFKSQYFEDEGPYVLVTPGNFFEKGGFKLRDGKDRSYSGDFAPEYLLRAGDLIVAMTEQGPGLLGSAAIIPEDGRFLHNQRIGLVSVKDERCASKKYLFHLFNTAPVRGQINGSATGTKVRHTAPERIYRVAVSLPDLPTQERIAGMLSAYDDLIENNRRRIALLEQAARLLYREWFVHFRFPGHETAKFVDGLPEGWSEQTVFDVVDVLGGGTPKTKVSSFWGNEIAFFTPKDTGDFLYTFETEKMITEEGLKSCNSRLYEKKTIFITARGTVGKIRLAQRPMAMNQSCYALKGKTGFAQEFLYFAISDRVNHLKGRAAGAVFDAIVVDTFKKIPMVVPSDDIAEKFTKLAVGTLQQIDNLSTQNRQLTAARDLLLPRLMDGRISV